MKLYHCEESQALVLALQEVNSLKCCDKEMEVLKAGTVDAAVEKHVPCVKREGNTLHVVVGEVEHPMTEEHWIQMIAVEQGDHLQVVTLHPNEAPKACFTVNDGPVTVYEFCNLHGLWKTEA